MDKTNLFQNEKVYCLSCDWEGSLINTLQSPLGPVCPHCWYDVSTENEELYQAIQNLQVKTLK